jgi:hypothetical protein
MLTKLPTVWRYRNREDGKPEKLKLGVRNCAPRRSTVDDFGEGR